MLQINKKIKNLLLPCFKKNPSKKTKPKQNKSKKPYLSKRNKTLNKPQNFLQRQKDRPFERTDYLKTSTGLG